jgi:hypothetical protein
MVISVLGADFNMAQFIQAECLTRSLLSLKDDLCQHGASSTILGLSLFRIFALQCGLLGTKSLEGSLFMTEKFCNQFLMGIDALKLLHEGPHSVYNRYLAERANLIGLSFNAEDQGSYAQARLLCLTRSSDAHSGREVSEAYWALSAAERAAFSDYLSADGIERKGFLLQNSPLFLDNARRNLKVGLVPAFRLLLAVYDASSREFLDSEAKAVTIILDELADHARIFDGPSGFVESTRFEVIRIPNGSGFVELIS